MQIDRNILLTGSTGFIGSHILKRLKFRKIVCLGRTQPHNENIDFFKSDLSKNEDFSSSLSDIDIVLHVAARAHVLKENENDPLSTYRKINTHASIHLAEEAAKNGVKRFIFISSIKVNGETTKDHTKFTYDQEPNPQDDYALSKLEAERGIKEVCLRTGMEFIIIRLPLVYGEGVKANFQSLISIVKKGIPLPFYNLRNKRSFLSIENLISILYLCLTKEEVKNITLLASDDRDLSTSELVEIIGKVADKKVLNFYFPPILILFFSKLLSKESLYQRLYGNLQVDIEYTKITLAWKPNRNIEDFIKDSVR